MQALFRKGTFLFSSNPQNGTNVTQPTTTAPEETLFTKVNPAVDGEDCDHDCASCTIRYPAKFDVNHEDELYGHVKAWSTHLLIATGKTDWVHDVADEEGSLMEAIEKGGLTPSNGRMKLSASNMPVPDEYHYHELGQQPTTALILPAFTIVDHITPALAPDLVKYFIDPSPTTTTPLLKQQGTEFLPIVSEKTRETNNSASPTTSAPQTPIETLDISTLTPLRSRPCPHAAVILLCSQRTRDARCGQSAPLLRREFERHLRARGLFRDLNDERPGGVGIYFISHVGGHKYSANVMVYRRRDFGWYRKQNGEVTTPPGEEPGDRTANGESGREEDADEGAAQGIWLARVKPEDCEGIVKFTVLQGKVVKPATQLRGGFDRERGLVSW
ncbi:hypothetical protein AJ80_07450 [Polytolypa hystricis UAMH7299]|uniref:Sucrase/ferredoxin-like family protein n=1 Tax=Polytolypa hystricis (strain UAMH7299) TaxID=1447883 RepID=A0A2B7XNP4_POLH7|nr:hypothetical protein AJ80_07450 [Polytolypa hystricis UAMH7299]